MSQAVLKFKEQREKKGKNIKKREEYQGAEI